MFDKKRERNNKKLNEEKNEKKKTKRSGFFFFWKEKGKNLLGEEMRNGEKGDKPRFQRRRFGLDYHHQKKKTTYIRKVFREEAKPAVLV